MRIINLDTIDSTNKYCELLNLETVEEFAVVNAKEQTAGHGQHGHHWESEALKNLTFSMILHPQFLPVSDQYEINKVLALGLTDYLKSAGIADVCIKWPNDIYVNHDKICGTLVENKLRGSCFHSAVCGVGLNVNQTIFPDWIPNPTSMRLTTHTEFNTDTVLTELCDKVIDRYEQLRANLHKKIDNDYLSNLKNLGVETAYLYHGEKILATILGVNRYGHLLLSSASHGNLTCQMGEITLAH